MSILCIILPTRSDHILVLHWFYLDV
ncbi:unnamed protein product [Spirodela intermedia]|uniref:Uncharacterized protein n=1 Tax=Spirodela intermedia TaxID=51605 RepID=A0A811GA42_SPIIN|nr:unnamed protein product [Spirodela intermedia]